MRTFARTNNQIKEKRLLCCRLFILFVVMAMDARRAPRKKLVLFNQTFHISYAFSNLHSLCTNEPTSTPLFMCTNATTIHHKANISFDIRHGVFHLTFIALCANKVNDEQQCRLHDGNETRKGEGDGERNVEGFPWRMRHLS